ncbi:hypothetical protein B0T26DRAFT_746628 [Lasiosphaeria miniovina]|uniref:Hsp70 family protein n=1 Tax=Lasiosphaeria miniovina TaxID=1954250 RepID=A0AA40BIC0_9PEZI|nr:uncharacterized protein B0T26DRAFT_746628 [Lasiosphaeria miniovina]KAK0734758.1 hypothetical protein B0T26DRAFT_746628 [Lasiosphaeria miniovina]
MSSNEVPDFDMVFKLFLDSRAATEAYHDTNLAATIGSMTAGDTVNRCVAPGKTVEQMCIDYLRPLYEHILDSLRQDNAQLDTLRIKFVITTPAMWSPASQDLKRHAAFEAGFGRRSADWVDIVSEPEAAANHSLKLLLRDNSRERQGLHSYAVAAGWEVGNNILIVDAGAGTVDTVVYEITGLDPLQVKETITPKGGLCGAASIGCAFHALLEERLGGQKHLLTPGMRSRGSTLMKNFEEHKVDFGTELIDDDATVSIVIHHGITELSPVLEHDITSHTINLTRADFQNLFDLAVDTVMELATDLERQVRAGSSQRRIKAMVLVGGFGSSAYLYDRLNRWAQAQEPPVYVNQPYDGPLAIAKGAVAYGINRMENTRRFLPCHYGVFLDFPYNPDEHLYADTYIDDFDGHRYCNTTVEWFAQKSR